MKISFINDGIFESYKSLVERREFSYIYMCVCVCVWTKLATKLVVA